MKDRRWKPRYYVDAYRLARAGFSDAKIARTLGVSPQAFKAWVNKRKGLQYALEQARGNDDDVVEQFHEYIYQSLPEELQTIWDEIMAVEAEDNSVRRMEALLKDCGKRARQHLFLHALVCSNFNVSKACHMVNISYSTYKGWVYHDPGFGQLIDEIIEHKKNFVEAALFKLIGSGDSAATIFASKTLNRDRGYSEKTEIQVSGEINHTHTHVISIDQLGLPLETRKEILKAVRAAKEQQQSNTIETTAKRIA